MKRTAGLSLGMCLLIMSGLVHAEAAEDDRIAQLQRMLEQQQRQMQAMAEELQALKKAKEADRGRSNGTPVLAAFKDGVRFEDASGNWQLALNGRVQFDGRAFSPDRAAADTWSVRRARLGGTVTLYKDYSARVEGEYAGDSTTLTYAYIDINKFKAARLRFGQFKPLYGLERASSSNFLDFQERSLADAVLGGSYDRGVMLHGSPFDGVYYSAAWINGNNKDENDVEYDNKDLMARVVFNAAPWVGWRDSVLHAGGFYASGRQEAGSPIPTVRTEGRGYTFFSTADTTANRFTDSVDRVRGGVELALAYGPVKLQGEYVRAEFDGKGFERDMSAWYASLNWLVTGERFADAYKDGVFGRLRPKRNFSFDGDGWGALQVGIRYSAFDGGDFRADNAAGTGRLAAGRTNEAHAWTLGANWILNPNLRLVANYVRTSLDDDVVSSGRDFDTEEAFTMRAQFDF
ncbi:MAG TPA: porin [Methylophilaceae bacterium]